MRTQVASSGLAESEPPMWGMATLAMEVSSASMNVASVTVMAMAQGLARGRHVSWNDVAAAANRQSTFRRDGGARRRAPEVRVRITL